MALRSVRLDLDRVHLGRVHLLIEELGDPPQLVGHHVGDEDHPDPAGAQVVTDAGEELINAETWIPRELRDLLPRLTAEPALGGLERRTQVDDRPVPDPVGGVVEHLPDYLTADARVRGPLHLDQGRDGVLVDEQMVHTPSRTGGRLAIRHTVLAPDQGPAAGLLRRHLPTGEQVWVRFEERLEHVLGGVWRHSQRRQAPVSVDLE